MSNPGTKLAMSLLGVYREFLKLPPSSCYFSKCNVNAFSPGEVVSFALCSTTAELITMCTLARLPTKLCGRMFPVGLNSLLTATSFAHSLTHLLTLGEVIALQL